MNGFGAIHPARAALVAPGSGSKRRSASGSDEGGAGRMNRTKPIHVDSEGLGFWGTKSKNIWSAEMEFQIKHTWNNFPVSHDPVVIKLTPENAGILMEVNAPFFNDPPAPLGDPGSPFEGLWDYEVIEAFFLNDQTQQYLEVELCPHGQHLVLLLSGRRKVCKQDLPLMFDVSRTNTKWTGRAHVPWSYFPPSIDKFNAYAIHGSGVDRIYEALYPVCQNKIGEEQKPDFHRLEYFKSFSLKQLMGEDWKQPGSDLWTLCE